MTNTRRAFRYIGLGLALAALVQLPFLIALHVKSAIIGQAILCVAGALSYALSFLGSQERKIRE